MTDELRALVDAANAAFAAQSLEAAIDLGRQMMALDPDDTHGPFHTARALRGLGRSDEAELILRNAPERWPDDDGILSIWASLPMQYHRWAEAIERFAMISARFPHISKFAYQRINMLIGTGRLDEARMTLKSAIIAFPDDQPLKSLLEKMGGHSVLQSCAENAGNRSSDNPTADGCPYPAPPNGPG